MELINFSEAAERVFWPSLEPERIASGFTFTEGPVWDKKEERLFFTNFVDHTIYTWSEKEKTRLYRSQSNRAVGLSMYRDGRIVSAETKNHAVTFADNEKSEIIAGRYQGKILNSPNDVIVRSDGAVLFTDPYSVAMGDIRELDFNGIYCVPVVEGGLSEEHMILLDDRMERPNGIAFSPDEKILYVNDTNQQLIQAYQMQSDNTASRIGTFCHLDESYGKGCADGMKVDIEGNVYVTGPGGIWLIGADGSPISILKTPEFVGNLCFGGSEDDILYITASTSVYRIQVRIPGIVPKREVMKWNIP